MLLFVLILALAFFSAAMSNYLIANPDYTQLDAYTWESEEFRNMELGPLVAQQEELDPQMIAALMVENDYDLTELSSLEFTSGPVMARKPEAYRKLTTAYETVVQDLKYFPIPDNLNEGGAEISYENCWMDTRTYGGERGHEGCDIMANGAERGYFPVISITDGVIEKIGWLEKGGWRIGIRSESGLYLYYAHLYSYAADWEEGDPIKAGTLLGYMGDSGYSAIPGTTGNFDVHLHLGLYIKTDHYDELSVNPYWLLKYLEKYRLEWAY